MKATFEQPAVTAQGPPPQQPGGPDDPRPEQPHPLHEPADEPERDRPGPTEQDEELGS